MKPDQSIPAFPHEHIQACTVCAQQPDAMFPHFSVREMAALQTFARHVVLPANTVLFTEGSVPDAVYILCSGHVKATVSYNTNKCLLVRVARPGDVLGLSAVLLHAVHEVSAQAMETVHLQSFSRHDFLRFIQRYINGTMHTALSINTEYRSALQDACRLALSRTVTERVVRLLLDLSTAFIENEQGEITISIAFTHEELASMSGTTRETITRVLSAMKKRHILAVNGGMISIHHSRMRSLLA